MMCTMDKVRKSGRMVPYFKASTHRVKRMVSVFISGQTRPYIKATGSTIRCEARELTLGMMVECSQANGWITICTASVCIAGLTAAAMKASTWRIRGTGWGRSHGAMVASTRGRGRAVKCMVRESIRILREYSRKVCGLRVIERSWWIKSLS